MTRNATSSKKYRGSDVEMSHIREGHGEQFALDLVRQLFLRAPNKESSSLRTFITAGAHQFHSVWVRDFCWGIDLWTQLHQTNHSGLFPEDIMEALTNTVQLCLFSPLNKEGFAPRGFDIQNPKLTVCLGLLGIPKIGFLNQNLRPEYTGEHGTVAFDSNLLLALLAINLTQAKPGSVLFKIKNQLNLQNSQLINLCKRFLECYVPYQDSQGILRQPAFSDWQDSARRETATSYIHFLYLYILQATNSARSIELTERYFNLFFDSKTKLFRSESDHPERISIESNLFALKKGIFRNFIDEKLFENSIVSFFSENHRAPVHVFYENRDISWTTKMCGLRHYHDQLIWPWQQHQLNFVRAKSGAPLLPLDPEFSFHEVLSPTSLKPFRTFLYRSESPFFWSICSYLGSKFRTE